MSEDNITKILKSGPKSNKELREELKLGGSNNDPKLDRVLQKLRKEGKIQVVQNRWALSTITKCATCEGRGWVMSATPTTSTVAPIAPKKKKK